VTTKLSGIFKYIFLIWKKIAKNLKYLFTIFFKKPQKEKLS